MWFSWCNKKYRSFTDFLQRFTTKCRTDMPIFIPSPSKLQTIAKKNLSFTVLINTLGQKHGINTD